MKTELQISKENVEAWKKDNALYWDSCNDHKQTCQRFLEFLEGRVVSYPGSLVVDKIVDLKNAIKEYEDNGI